MNSPKRTQQSLTVTYDHTMHYNNDYNALLSHYNAHSNLLSHYNTS